jgi:hypothetical protein
MLPRRREFHPLLSPAYLLDNSSGALAFSGSSVHNIEMKTAARLCLAVVFIGCIALAIFLLWVYGTREKEIWATLTGLLAVIAAVIAAWPAIRFLEIQEDALRPRPTPYFDLASRYNLVQLRVKNLGGGVAYDVQLRWNTHPLDHEGNKITSLDYISALLPQESVSTLVGVCSTVVREFSDTRFEGECLFKDSTGKKFRQKFLCSVDASQKQLVHDDELPKTLWELQKIPEELSRIAKQLENFNADS